MSNSGKNRGHRVVVTGMGWITPLGHDLETAWTKLQQSASGVDRISLFDAGTFPTQIAAEVRGFKLDNHIPDMTGHEHAGRNSMFALAACQQAWRAAGLDAADLDLDQVGIYLGSGEGSVDLDAFCDVSLGNWQPDLKAIACAGWAKAALARMDVNRELEQEPNMPLAHLALLTGARGPAFNCLTACAASTQAIGEASEILRRGEAQVMISGGAHSMIHPFGVTGFNRLTALSERNAEPTRASRPFDAQRGGFVLGEGSGIVILETLEHARNRNAKILAEVTGYGSTADAYRITDQDPEVKGAVEAMRMAIRHAGIQPGDIDYINAHGTGTKENDGNETAAIKIVFGDRAKQVPISSIKSMMGHLIAAAGAVELITCVLAIRDQVLPPTINLENPDPDCDLDYVPNAARKAKVETALSNSFGFGGQNDSILVRRFAE